jgi:hypothetical protein
VSVFTLWERREPVEKGAIGSEAQARRVIQSIEARAVELHGEPHAGGEERRRLYESARDYIAEAEGRMKKSDDRAGFFSDEAGAKLYAAAAGVAAHDARAALEGIDAVFLEALEPVVELLKRDGLTQAQALDRAASICPRWYALKRAAWNERASNETRRATEHLDAARESVRTLVAKAQGNIRKGSRSNEDALRAAATEAPAWSW